MLALYLIESFTQKLSQANLKYFNELTKKVFSEQAIAFLNAYWEELGSQADFIYEISWKAFKEADMRAKGENYLHLYEEGNELDFNIALYFFEILNKAVSSSKDKEWVMDEKYKVSQPIMQTAIVRKKELREKVDFNFDGRVSFIEYLLYQYESVATPQGFMDRSLKMKMDHPEVSAAKKDLKEVNKAISSFETEKQRLQELVNTESLVKGMKAKHELAILKSGNLAQELEQTFIRAEASLRKVSKQFRDGVESTPILHGSLWWMQKELESKKAFTRKHKINK